MRILALLGYLKPERPEITKASVYTVLNTVFDVLPEILIGVAVDLVINREQSFLSRFGVSDPWHQMLLLTGITLLIWICESVTQYLYEVSWRNIAQKVQHRLRMACFSNYLTLDMTYLNNQKSGHIMSILNDDVNQLESFLNIGCSRLIHMVTSAILVGIVFFILSPTVAFLAFLPIPLIIAGSFFFQKRLTQRYANLRTRVSELNNRLSGTLSGLAVVKSYQTESFETRQVESLSQNYMDANRDAIQVSAAFIPIVRMGVLAGFAATLIYGGYLALEGDLAVGSYSVLIFLTQRLLWPLTRLAEISDNYERSMASTDRIVELLKQKSSHESQGNKPIKAFDQQFEFRDVDFAYTEENLVLKTFNLKIHRGQTTAFVGTTGSGKSTLIKLLLRFYSPSAGSLTVDGAPISDFSMQAYRNLFGYVSQDTFLVDGTIEDNIAYGESHVDKDKVLRAAELAEASEFIKELPDGLATTVGERGIKLSGGQKQRISIARMLYRNPQILIFDEATSAVDNETERAMQVSIQKLSDSKDYALILIAHRLSTVRNADRIHVIDKGKIIESGTHDELTALGGTYAHLWRVQLGESVEQK